MNIGERHLSVFQLVNVFLVAHPTCSRCGKGMKDWNGQVLRDRQLGSRMINWIKVMCRPSISDMVEL